MRILILIWTIIFTVGDVAAQCDSLLQVVNEQAGYRILSRLENGMPDTVNVLNPDMFGAKFRFIYYADSSQTVWTFSEFLLNRQKLYLSNWCKDRTVNWSDSTSAPVLDWSEEQLRQRSTTRVFPISGLDTVQFYRELSWVDRSTLATSFNNYVNRNGLTFSVELVRANNNQRMILLDSFRIESTTSTHKPCIYSWYPMMARVRTVIPAEEDSTDVFIRVNVGTLGADPVPFVRYDNYGRMLSTAHLTNSYWLNYVDSVETNISCVAPQVCHFTAIVSSSPTGLEISHNWPTSISEISVRNIYGDQIWSSSLPLSTNPTWVSLQSGLYIVVGVSNGNVICTKKLLVQ
ncbi:MAG: hypothetical protein HQ472_03935 [Ignavibacteria bacterium]|nr:hypothetical protein [Ignavibacteria bacterium]